MPARTAHAKPAAAPQTHLLPLAWGLADILSRSAQADKYPLLLRDLTRRALNLEHHAARSGWQDTLTALPLAAAIHQDQPRQSGGPYFAHPLAVAEKLCSHGITQDCLIAAALPHDAPEDHPDRITFEELRHRYKLRPRTVAAIQALTQDPAGRKEDYYARVAANPDAALVKLADRWHNLTTMTKVRTPAAQQRKASETCRFVLPLAASLQRRDSPHAAIARALAADVQRAIATLTS